MSMQKGVLSDIFKVASKKLTLLQNMEHPLTCTIMKLWPREWGDDYSDMANDVVIHKWMHEFCEWLLLYIEWINLQYISVWMIRVDEYCTNLVAWDKTSRRAQPLLVPMTWSCWNDTNEKLYLMFNLTWPDQYNCNEVMRWRCGPVLTHCQYRRSVNACFSSCQSNF